MNSSLDTHRSSDLNGLHDDIHGSVKTVVKSARKHVVEPVVTLVHDAQRALSRGAKRAKGTIRKKMAGTQKKVSAKVQHTKKTLTRQSARASSWISANKFAAVGLALVTGAVLVSIARRLRA